MPEFLHKPESPNGTGVVLTHGSGANCATPLLAAVAEALSSAGAVVLRYDLPFRQRRPSGPPSPANAATDRAGIREAVARMREMVSGPVVMAGHSYGGRQSSMLAAEEPELANGLLLLAYPLHPPGRPDKMRTAHLQELRTPALFVSGTRDQFGTPDEMTAALGLMTARVRLVTIDRAGHDLARGKFDIAARLVQPLWDLIVR